MYSELKKTVVWKNYANFVFSLEASRGSVLPLSIYGENNNFRFLGWGMWFGNEISRFILIRLHTSLVLRFSPFPLFNEASLLRENYKSTFQLNKKSELFLWKFVLVTVSLAGRLLI